MVKIVYLILKIGYHSASEIGESFSMKALMKLLFVDSLVNILGDLFEQPLVMWAFIGWGWLCILVMATSVYQTLSQM